MISNSVNAREIKEDFGWVSLETFETGSSETVQRYLDNFTWYQHVRGGYYHRQRFGVIESTHGTVA